MALPESVLPAINWHALARFAARAYVSGPELKDALATARRLAPNGFASTICYWNRSHEPPEAIAAACIEALAEAEGEASISSISVKFSPLEFNQALLHRILHAASGTRVCIHFDAHGPESAEPTFLAMEQAIKLYPHLGCTLPGRWQRSCADAERAMALGLQVRVVKGQWADIGHSDLDPRPGYLRVVDQLAGRASLVAVATHDGDLGRESLQRLLRRGTECLLELLYGLPMQAPLAVAREMGVPVRIYIPFGYGCLPYCLTQVRSNPWIVLWLLRDAISGGLLRTPNYLPQIPKG